MAKPGDAWTTLGELKPGSLFEGVNGRKAVRSSSTSDHGDYITTVTLDDGHMARDRANLIVRPLPSPLTDEDREQARYELAAILHQLRTPAVVREAGTYSDPDEWTSPDLHAPGQILTLPLSRLLWLLSLPRELLGFVLRAAEHPTDADHLKVFSDWLKEHQCEADGEAMAAGWRERLMELIHMHGSAMAQAAIHDSLNQHPARIKVERRAARWIAAIRQLIGLPGGG